MVKVAARSDRVKNSVRSRGWGIFAGKGDDGLEERDRGDSYPFDAPKSLDGLEGAEGIAVGDDPLGQRRPDAWQGFDFLGRGGVEVDSGAWRDLPGGFSRDGGLGWQASDVGVDPRPGGRKAVRGRRERLIGPCVARRHTRHAGDDVRRRGGSGGVFAFGGFGSGGCAVRCGGLPSERLLLELGWGGGSGPEDPNGAAKENHDGDEGEGFLFGWCWHGTNMRRASRGT